MTLSANTVWEVRTGGNDSNGGGFVSGAGGTDYSQQDSPQVAFDGTTVSFASDATGLVLTLTGHTGSSADVGNLLQITGGTGFTTGFYEITAATSTTWTIDSDCGHNKTGGQGNMGGGLLTISKVVTLTSEGGMIAYIKAGTYSLSSPISTFATEGGAGTIRFVGYSTTHGDGGRATIQASAGSMTMLTPTVTPVASFYSFENLVFDGNNQTAINGVSLVNMQVAAGVGFYNCIFKNMTGQYCVSIEPARVFFDSCEFLDNAFTVNISACIGDYETLTSVEFLSVKRCYFHGNSITSTNVASCIRIMFERACVVASRNIFASNTGTNFDGIYVTGGVYDLEVSHNIFHANGRHGIDGFGRFHVSIDNNIFTSNGGYGILYEGADNIATLVSVSHNAYYNNASGATSGFTSGGGDQTLTGLPYVSAGSDFSLNNTAGAGAACRDAGIPGSIGLVSSVGTGYLDIGPLQHQCTGGQTVAYTFVS